MFADDGDEELQGVGRIKAIVSPLFVYSYGPLVNSCWQIVTLVNESVDAESSPRNAKVNAA